MTINSRRPGKRPKAIKAPKGKPISAAIKVAVRLTRRDSPMISHSPASNSQIMEAAVRMARQNSSIP